MAAQGNVVAASNAVESAVWQAARLTVQSFVAFQMVNRLKTRQSPSLFDGFERSAHLSRPLPFELFLDFFQGHDIRILVMQVE